MPHLQSIVIVLLKVVLTNVSATVNQTNGSNGAGAGLQSQDNGPANGITKNKSSVNVAQQGGNPHGQSKIGQSLEDDTYIEELDGVRLREITGKAVSGALLLLLKWFKVSRKLEIPRLVYVVNLRMQTFSSSSTSRSSYSTPTISH